MAGYGDELIASGLARGAAMQGKRIAFGDGTRIRWGPHSAEIFKGNPNVAPPGSEQDQDIEWIHYYKGRRNYVIGRGTHFDWNYEFHPKPGEVFFESDELEFAQTVDAGLIFIEPNVPWQKKLSVNKDWGFARYQAVADRLRSEGYPVAQFAVGRDRLTGARVIDTPSFRHSLAVLARAALAITPEGGLHHGAAAVGTPAVVLFGGFIPPGATGYATHTNLTGNATVACGRLDRCEHCRAAFDAITVEHVYDAAIGHLGRRAAA